VPSLDLQTHYAVNNNHTASQSALRLSSALFFPWGCLMIIQVSLAHKVGFNVYLGY
jgi:hypothetical protein